jgi:hypothetical protein
MIGLISDTPLSAIIETDYAGGIGDQAAAVYQGACEVMPPKTARIGPINEALRTLGVAARPPLDEFDTIGLGRYRNFEDPFDDHVAGE